jgi:hypothetical protein
MGCCPCCCENASQPGVCCGPVGSQTCCKSPRQCCGETCCPSGQVCVDGACEPPCDPPCTGCSECVSGSCESTCQPDEFCCDGTCQAEPCEPPCDPPCDGCSDCVDGDCISSCSEGQYCCDGVCQDEPCATPCETSEDCPSGLDCCNGGCEEPVVPFCIPCDDCPNETPNFTYGGVFPTLGDALAWIATEDPGNVCFSVVVGCFLDETLPCPEAFPGCGDVRGYHAAICCP